MTSWRFTRGISAFLLIAACSLFLPSNAVAADCACKNIGLSFCIPDPACFAEKPTAQSATTLKIRESGYSPLPELSKEEPGYGLYSYVILSSNSDRSSALLGEVFKSAPVVDDSAAQRPQVNMVYIPIKKENVNDFAEAVSSLRDDAKALGERYAESLYDYETARDLLKRVCNKPVDAMRNLCAGDMSQGPYLFTAGRPAGSAERIPVPSIFVDLSNIDPRAYGEFIAAFRAQVNRQDGLEGPRINSLKTKMLAIALKPSDWLSPAQTNIASIVTSVGPAAAAMVYSSAPPRILETGYSPLPELGKEKAGYGLYSYIILSSNSDRSSALLGEVFKVIPDVQGTAAPIQQTNILYIPMLQEQAKNFPIKSKTLSGDKLGAEYASSFYDYKMARGLLNHLCNPPGDTMRELCAGDTSRGPYIFSYGSPASALEPVPAPYLFLDLSDVDPRAYGEFISAFRAQVKREDISDGARINALRLKILNIALKASDWISPVHKALADIVK